MAAWTVPCLWSRISVSTRCRHSADGGAIVAKSARCRLGDDPFAAYLHLLLPDYSRTSPLLAMTFLYQEKLFLRERARVPCPSLSLST
ncbi:hypothetical protein PRIO_2467 [Paenibacillus riograndensis SBR5]|uniref:Uncharacterized protein n=1 Tax=Paenibacillus riograndensis SBR5 TaxID=1073571 RepID=A0A0E3WH90_9BACL|nr:hypothetical protein PRIO_2467 [Paenibacillus riograndensis SBR5]